MLRITFENGEEYVSDYYNDPFMIAFLEDYILRDSCFTCKNKDDKYVSDVTIGDFWGYETFFGNIDDYGISAAIINSHKGEMIISDIVGDAVVLESTIDDMKVGNPSYYSSVKRKKLINQYKKIVLNNPNWWNRVFLWLRFESRINRLLRCVRLKK